MFAEAGRSLDVLDAMAAPHRAWLEPRLASGAYFGFAVEDEGVVASVGLMAIDWPPHPAHPAQDKRGYVLDVYVQPSHRRRGIARALMTLAEQTFVTRGLSFAVLHATAAGKPLYERLGWSGTSEMAKTLGMLEPT